ncbi:MAG: OmpH family outer membrane protein [Planktotalea sp.]|uniref:OmpH family outer membrane protein n=1 Tax=Planktotalea sp. TaxID=2029877 RepID=UPI003C73C39D
MTIAALFMACTLPIAVSTSANAQSTGFALPEIPVLTIEPDRLFAGTRFGQSLSKEIEARGNQLAAENRRIEKELADEEGELTGKRETMTPEEFRVLADDFDLRVTTARSAQDEKARALAALSDQAQLGFLQAIAPILEAMMNENGASVILDRRAVFLSADASDITTAAVRRIDEKLADGAGLSELLPEVDAETTTPKQ